MNVPITVRLWGVRGSIPSPGETTFRVGGNTPCATVEFGDEKCLVLDAGTGIRNAGKHLVARNTQIYVLLTHEHWDHIQGFPFFAPLYQKGRRLVIFPVERGMDMFCSLIDQMDGAHFPVTHRELPSLGECLTVDPLTYLAAEGIPIARHRTNHPGKCYGYRIGPPERSVVFMPDNELNPPGYRWTTVEQLADFCRGAKLLIHDAQFTPEDMPAKRGWGHSLVGEACELAASAGVGHLVLFHHDPERTDDQLDKIEAGCREWFAKNAPATKVSVGREGMSITI